MDPQATAYIVLGVVLIATFISVFFFTYVSKVEADIVKSQMTNIVDDLTDGSRLVLSPSQINTVGDLVQNDLTVPDMSAEDAKVAMNNNALKKKAMKVFGIIIGVGLLVLMYLWYTHKLNMGEIIKYSLIILVVVAVTEYTFVTQITKNYQIVDPNFVRYLIANNLQMYAQS